MEIANLVGYVMAVYTASGRNYVGTVAFINPQNLTVTLANAWSEQNFFDMIIIKATDIIDYDFLQQTCDEQNVEPPKKIVQRKTRYVLKQVTK